MQVEESKVELANVGAVVVMTEVTVGMEQVSASVAAMRVDKAEMIVSNMVWAEKL